MPYTSAWAAQAERHTTVRQYQSCTALSAGGGAAAPVHDSLHHQVRDFHIALGHSHGERGVHARSALTIEHRAAVSTQEGAEEGVRGAVRKSVPRASNQPASWDALRPSSLAPRVTVAPSPRNAGSSRLPPPRLAPSHGARTALCPHPLTAAPLPCAARSCSW